MQHFPPHTAHLKEKAAVGKNFLTSPEAFLLHFPRAYHIMVVYFPISATDGNL